MHASNAVPFRATRKLSGAALVAVVATVVSGWALPAYAATAPTAPTAPITAVVGPGSGTATVSWSVPSSNGGAAITSYTVVSNPGAISATTPDGSTLSLAVHGLTNGTTYTFTVTATNSVGSGPASVPSNAVTPASPPGQPFNVVATPGDASVGLTWSAPNDGGSIIDSYLIEVTPTSPAGATSARTVTQPNPSTPAPTSTTVTGLTNGTSYSFTVTAHNAAGYGPASGATSPVTPNALPGAPTAVTASAGNQQATVSWTAPSNVSSANVTSYTVTSNPGGLTQTLVSPSPGAVPPTTTTFGGLTNGVTYTFTVRATNSFGSGPASAASNAVTPSALPGTPTNVVASPADHQVTLSWTAPNDGGSRIDSYTVQAFVNGASGATTTVNAANSSVAAPTSVTLTGLTDGASYRFTVTAHNALGNGPTSALSAAVVPGPVPSAPGGVTASAGNGSATVSWNAANGNGSAIDSYTVTSSPGGIVTTVSGSPAPTTAFVNGLTNGVTYTFTVAAHNAVGTGPSSNPSNAVTPTGPPAAPTNVVATAGDHQVSLTWVAPNNGGFRIDRYVVTEFPDGIVTNVNAPTSTTSAPTNVIITGLSNGQSYTFTVAAHTANGTSAPSQASTPVTPFGLPSAPTNLVGTPADSQVNLTWTAPSNNGARIDRYTIIMTSPGNTQTNVFAPDNVSSAPTSGVVSGLTNGVAYTFTVLAHNAAGNGPASAKSATITPSGAVATFAVATPGDGQATVTWSPAAVPAGDSIMDYKVTASPGGLTRFVGAGTLSTVMSPLTNGTTYTFTVTTEYTSGAAPTSHSSNAVTPQFVTHSTTPSTRTINGGTTVQVFGTLLRSNGTPVVGVPVTINQRTGGSSAFFPVDTAITGPDGFWSSTQAPDMHSTFRMAFDGDAADAGTMADQVVLVKAVVTWLSPQSGTTVAAGTIRFQAFAAGAVQGTKTSLQYIRSDGTWHDLAYGSIGSNGATTFVRSLGTGHWILRVMVARTIYDFGNTSRPASLHVGGTATSSGGALPQTG
jgi:hypothetical protein